MRLINYLKFNSQQLLVDVIKVSFSLNNVSGFHKNGYEKYFEFIISGPSKEISVDFAFGHNLSKLHSHEGATCFIN